MNLCFQNHHKDPLLKLFQRLCKILNIEVDDTIYLENINPDEVINQNNIGSYIPRLDKADVVCVRSNMMTFKTENLKEEKDFGINNFETYEIFAKRVKESKDELVRCLSNLKHNGKSIISIGATSKSTTVFNYCGIDDIVK